MPKAIQKSCSFFFFIIVCGEPLLLSQNISPLVISAYDTGIYVGILLVSGIVDIPTFRTCSHPDPSYNG